MPHPKPAELLPHAEPMVLIDEVLSWDACSIICGATSHLNPANPLRVAGQLSVFTGVEYAAQAMAAHNRLLNLEGTAPAQGFIATASKLEAEVDHLDQGGGPLTIEANQIATSGESSLYRFTLHSNDCQLLTGQLMVVKQAAPAT